MMSLNPLGDVAIATRDGAVRGDAEKLAPRGPQGRVTMPETGDR